MKGQWWGGHWGTFRLFGGTLGRFEETLGGTLGDMGGFVDMGSALGTLERLWGLRVGHTDFEGALGTLGRPLGILGRH